MSRSISRVGAARGSALIAALVVVVALSLLCLSLLMTTTQLTLGRSEAQKTRALTAADRGWPMAFERLSRSPCGPFLGLRHLALPRTEQDVAVFDTSWIESADSGFRIELSRPRFVSLGRPMGSDLRSFDQEGLYVERYGYASIAGRERTKESVRIEFELETSPVVSEALSLPDIRYR